MTIATTGVRWTAVLTTLGVVVVLPYLAILGWLKWHESDLVFQTAATP